MAAKKKRTAKKTKKADPGQQSGQQQQQHHHQSAEPSQAGEASQGDKPYICSFCEHWILTRAILTGRDNWIPWLDAFKEIAQARDFWGLFNGGERLRERPHRATYFGPDATAYTVPAPAEGEEADPADEARDHSVRVKLFKAAKRAYRLQSRRLRRAMKLLRKHILPSIRSNIQDVDSPRDALMLLKGLYGMHGPDFLHTGPIFMGFKCAISPDGYSVMKYWDNGQTELCYTFGTPPQDHETLEAVRAYVP